jgi:hypothetical protein
MPYEMSLEPDRDRGGHRYEASVSGPLDAAAIRGLSDWMADARLNPDASFVIDLSRATGTSTRARLEVRSLLRRHRSLVAERRLTVVQPARASRPRRATAAPTIAALLR